MINLLSDNKFIAIWLGRFILSSTEPLDANMRAVFSTNRL